MINPMSRTDKAILFGLIAISVVIMIFAVIGVYDAIWNVPNKCTEIAELTNQLNVSQARVKELDKYVEIQNKNIATREDKYRVACKCSKLFMLVADPDQVMDFEDFEAMLRNKKQFFKPVNIKKGG